MSDESTVSTSVRVARIHEQIDIKFPKNMPTQLEKFFISDKIRKQILFTEELQLVTYDSEEELGSVKISVSLCGQNNDIYVVRSSVKGTINGEECGSSVMSLVDGNFITIQERRTQYAFPGSSSPKFPSERHIFYVQESKGYHCSVTQKHKEESHVDTEVSTLDYRYTKYLIGEGANLLLLRYLAITGYSGEFDAVTVLLSGRLHLVHYTSTGTISKEVQGRETNVVVIERTINTSKTLEEKMITTLTRTGQEVVHEWDEWSYHYRVRPLQKIGNVIKNSVANINIPLHLQWEQDVQMVSKYLDKKERQHASHNSYIIDCPDVRHILSDFVQSLLLLKPKRVMPFAVEHFAAFAEPVGANAADEGTSDADAEAKSAFAAIEAAVLGHLPPLNEL